MSFKKHVNACDGTGVKYKIKDEKRLTQFDRDGDKCTCPHCFKQFSVRGIHSHIRLVHNTESNSKSFGPVWNKGLTKDTDRRVKKNAEATSKAMKGKPSFAWSDEQKKAQSERKKALYIAFPEKHPNRKVAGNRGKMTFPEKVAYDWFKCNNINAEHQCAIRLPDDRQIFPDFRIGNLLIEIDGSYWHDHEKDKLRDSLLNKLGYRVERIDAKARIEETLEKIFKLDGT